VAAKYALSRTGLIRILSSVDITIRPVSSSTDYAAWRQVRMAVLPDERTPTIDELEAQAGPQQKYVLAELNGTLAGSGIVGKSSLGGPACRRAGGVARPAGPRRGIGAPAATGPGGHRHGLHDRGR